MQVVIRTFCILLCLAVSVPCFAVDPTPGTYGTSNTSPPDGTVFEGRASNSWSGPSNGGSGVGNVFNSMSWDGGTLGTEWVFQCGVSISQTTTNNIDGNGNGTFLFTTTYGAGTFWLSKDGPWGDSVNDLTGTTGTLTRSTTISYVLGNPVSAVENAATSGHFDDSNCSLTFAISNAIGVGDTDSVAFPVSGYPGLLDTDCSTPRADGSWGDIISLAMGVLCPVAVEETTWTQMKSTFQE
jgi:hypothetical protein